MQNHQVRKIAFYGKGGIGKSTVASNLSAALTEMGEKVMQIGCSPKTDSTSFLCGGKVVEPDILSMMRERGTDKDNVLECIKKGYGDILCVECGGPEPAIGCAGRGVTVALDLLTKYRIPEESKVSFIIYDVIGDVVCGGFALPIRAGHAREIYIVTSGELMSLYSANNICIAIADMSKTKKDSVRIGGLVNNMRGVQKEEELVEEFAQKLGVPVMAHIPRSRTVQEAESEGGTVIEKKPQSEQAEIYRQMAKTLRENPALGVPTPITIKEIMGLLRKYQALD